MAGKEERHKAKINTQEQHAQMHTAVKVVQLQCTTFSCSWEEEEEEERKKKLGKKQERCLFLHWQHATLVRAHTQSHQN